ncbi:TPA: hypothetical protein GXZ34_01910 [bacterium]|nr:hypothetical protein [bacterium]
MVRIYVYEKKLLEDIEKVHSRLISKIKNNQKIIMIVDKDGFKINDKQLTVEIDNKLETIIGLIEANDLIIIKSERDPLEEAVAISALLETYKVSYFTSQIDDIKETKKVVNYQEMLAINRCLNLMDEKNLKKASERDVKIKIRDSGGKEIYLVGKKGNKDDIIYLNKQGNNFEVVYKNMYVFNNLYSLMSKNRVRWEDLTLEGNLLTVKFGDEENVRMFEQIIKLFQ